MTREELIALCDRQIKLVRTEYSLNQEKMALTLGISKKTLVEIEKGRSSLGWTGSAAFCAIFADSELLQRLFGGDPQALIRDLAFQGGETPPSKAAGKLWWQTVTENERYLIQQNIISQHFRLVTRDGRRIASSFDLEDLLPLFNGSTGEIPPTDHDLSSEGG